jgi:hypothetical protein
MSRTIATPFVMRGLDPRIHPLRKSLSKTMDCRVKPGNDGMNRSINTLEGI